MGHVPKAILLAWSGAVGVVVGVDVVVDVIADADVHASHGSRFRPGTGEVGDTPSSAESTARALRAPSRVMSRASTIITAMRPTVSPVAPAARATERAWSPM